MSSVSAAPVAAPLAAALAQDEDYWAGVRQADMLPMLWWALLVLGSFVNLAVLLNRLANLPRDPYARKMTYCAACFIVGCAVRSIWPRVDVERTCFWDTKISTPFVGRVLATVAEICFAAQFSMTIGVLAKEVEFPRTQRVSKLFFWAICVAQCCCWLGVTTKRQLWHCIEEGIWALTFAGVAVCFAVLNRPCKRALPSSLSCCGGICEPGDAGYTRRVLCLGFPLSVVYVVFMVLVDVPMYLNRYLADQARGAPYLWVSEGLLDTMTCSKVSKSNADWEPEMPWMTGYFLGATALSLWLTWGPRIGHRVKGE